MYPNEALNEILAPAYEPCRRMRFRGPMPASQWNLASGHVPRGFHGGTGELDEVELVIVLAEPGDPKGTEMYADGLTPSDTVRRVVDFVRQTYANREERRVELPRFRGHI